MAEPVELVALPSAMIDDAGYNPASSGNNGNASNGSSSTAMVSSSILTSSVALSYDDRGFQITNVILLYTIFGDQTTVSQYVAAHQARIAASLAPARRRSSARLATNMMSKLVAANQATPPSDSTTHDSGAAAAAAIHGTLDETFESAGERFERSCTSYAMDRCKLWFHKEFDNDHSGHTHRQRNLIDSSRAGLDPITFVEMVMKLTNLSHHDALDLFDIFGKQIIHYSYISFISRGYLCVCYVC